MVIMLVPRKWSVIFWNTRRYRRRCVSAWKLSRKLSGWWEQMSILTLMPKHWRWWPVICVISKKKNCSIWKRLVRRTGCILMEKFIFSAFSMIIWHRRVPIWPLVWLYRMRNLKKRMQWNRSCLMGMFIIWRNTEAEQFIHASVQLLRPKRNSRKSDEKFLYICRFRRCMSRFQMYRFMLRIRRLLLLHRKMQRREQFTLRQNCSRIRNLWWSIHLIIILIMWNWIRSVSPVNSRISVLKNSHRISCLHLI